MPDLPLLSFAHHRLPLPLPTGAAAEAKGHAVTAKVFGESAERIHAALAMAGRYELAAVPHEPDFFADARLPKKTRNHVWETMRTTVRLQWLIPTRRPDLISGLLPPTWLGKGFQNVCVGYLADCGEPLGERLHAFRNTPLPHRLVLLNPSSPMIGDPDELANISWVILTGGWEDGPLAEHLGKLCKLAGAAFLFHQPATGSMGPVPQGDESESAPTCPLHPFGNRIHLFTPTLPGLGNAASPSHSGGGTIHPLGLPPTEILHTTSGTTRITAAPDPAGETPDSNPSVPAVVGADRTDFDRLDGVIRRGLATFIEVGNALAEIRERELWRTGGHSSWADYCVTIGGLSKQHANRLIVSSGIATELREVEPIGSTLPTISPAAESQVRPLARVNGPNRRLEAWNLAVARSGGSPTAAQVMAAVREVTGTPDHALPRTATSRKSPVLAAFIKLREAYQSGRGRVEIERLMARLEKLLESA